MSLIPQTKFRLAESALKIFALIIVVIFLSGPSFSQENSEQKTPSFVQYQEIQPYKTKVILKNQQVVKGLLYQVRKDEIILLPIKFDGDSHFKELAKNGQYRIKIDEVKSVFTRNLKSGQNSIL